MTFEVVEHDGSTLNLILKNGKKLRVEILVHRSGEILDVVYGTDKIDDEKNEFNMYYALELLRRTQEKRETK